MLNQDFQLTTKDGEEAIIGNINQLFEFVDRKLAQFLEK
jgi:hypothetical protein